MTKLLLLWLLFYSIGCHQTSPSAIPTQETLFQPNFTTGIRLIFQDSKGNYWLGSHQEGVGVFDGKSFQYFSVDNGLLDHQIRSIKETKDGKVCIQTANE